MQFGPGFLPTFLYYFTTTALLFTVLANKGMGLSLHSGLPQQVGLASGVIAGLIGAYFNRSTTLSLPIQSQKKFLAALEPALTEMGYHYVSEEEGIRVYERSNLSKWLSGKVYLQFEQNNTVTIASRAATLRRLQKMSW